MGFSFHIVSPQPNDDDKNDDDDDDDDDDDGDEGKYALAVVQQFAAYHKRCQKYHYTQKLITFVIRQLSCICFVLPAVCLDQRDELTSIPECDLKFWP